MYAPTYAHLHTITEWEWYMRVYRNCDGVTKCRCNNNINPFWGSLYCKWIRELFTRTKYIYSNYNPNDSLTASTPIYQCLMPFNVYVCENDCMCVCVVWMRLYVSGCVFLREMHGSLQPTTSHSRKWTISFSVTEHEYKQNEGSIKWYLKKKTNSTERQKKAIT